MSMVPRQTRTSSLQFRKRDCRISVIWEAVRLAPLPFARQRMWPFKETMVKYPSVHLITSSQVCFSLICLSTDSFGLETAYLRVQKWMSTSFDQQGRVVLNLSLWRIAAFALLSWVQRVIVLFLYHEGDIPFTLTIDKAESNEQSLAISLRSDYFCMTQDEETAFAEIRKRMKKGSDVQKAVIVRIYRGWII